MTSPLSDGRSTLGSRPTGRVYLTVRRGMPHGRIHYRPDPRSGFHDHPRQALEEATQP